MSKVKIDIMEPLQVVYHYEGTYVKDIGDENEYKEEIYNFEVIDDGTNQRILWFLEYPFRFDNEEEIEEEIINYYKDLWR